MYRGWYLSKSAGGMSRSETVRSHRSLGSPLYETIMTLSVRFTFLACAGMLLVGSSVATAQPKPDKRLAQKVSVQIDNEPISKVLKDLGEKNKMKVEIDPSVAADGIDSIPFSLTADGITLGSVLHILCESQGLISYFEKGNLIVTTATADESKLFNREYALAPLGPAADPQVLSFNLVGLTSGNWMAVDQEGGDILAMSPQGLTIRQTRTVHAEIQALFDQIAAAGRPRAQSLQDRAEAAIIKKLQAPVPFPEGGTETPLSKLLDQILRKNGIPYWVDTTALSDEGIEWDKLNATVEVAKISTAKRLDAIVAEHKLAWQVADEVVQFTTEGKAAEQMSTRVYDVRNAKLPIGAIAEQLTSNKDLGPWMAKDEEGGVIMQLGGLLVIRQTGKSHAQIAKLLKGNG